MDKPIPLQPSSKDLGLSAEVRRWTEQIIKGLGVPPEMLEPLPSSLKSRSARRRLVKDLLHDEQHKKVFEDEGDRAYSALEVNAERYDYNKLVDRYDKLKAHLELVLAHNEAQSKGLTKLSRALQSASDGAKIQRDVMVVLEDKYSALRYKLGICSGDGEADRFEGI
jgi:hypothetical protein